MLDKIRAFGFDAVESGGSTLARATDRLPLVRVDRSAEVRVVRDSFAGRIASDRASRVVMVGQNFEPVIVVRDEGDFGAAVAAERLGVPHVSVVVLAAGGMTTPELLAKPLAQLRAEVGLPPSPDFLNRFLTLAPVMPSFRDPTAPLPSPSLAIRPDILDTHQFPTNDAAADRLNAWLAQRPGLPLVYFTLGTIFHQESGDLFPRVLTGLKALNANIVVTVGHELDPAELGVSGENVLIERFIPQRALLPKAAVVVSHGGSGTVVSALACGVPLVLLPMGADQPWNADRCETLGVGRVLDPLVVSSGEVAAAVKDVLETRSYRTAARAMQAEAESLPTVEVAADAVEQLFT
jgi:UDP:flavonoid glycosyltransferase YjiC (YdhE family)